MNHTVTVSIGVSMYNEERNIGTMLHAIKRQKTHGFTLKEIVVISDGSTDASVTAARAIKHPLLRVIDSKKRKGKTARINELFRTLQGDIIILFDADCVPGDKFVLERIVGAFQSQSEVMLVSANIIPVMGRSIVERGLNNFRYALMEYMTAEAFSNSAYGTRGTCIGLRKVLSDKLRIPEHIVNDDTYIHLFALTNGYVNTYVPDARVYYRSPSSINDAMKQNIRYIKGGQQLETVFGKDRFAESFRLPPELNTTIMMYQLKKDPVAYALSKVLCVISSLSALYSFSVSTKWIEIKSSKDSLAFNRLS